FGESFYCRSNAIPLLMSLTQQIKGRQNTSSNQPRTTYQLITLLLLKQKEILYAAVCRLAGSLKAGGSPLRALWKPIRTLGC
ncbi:MAG: hypothetical protein ACI9CF_001633, partial [Candidatus Omnitrophota bacterium]